MLELIPRPDTYGIYYLIALCFCFSPILIQFININKSKKDKLVIIIFATVVAVLIGIGILSILEKSAWMEKIEQQIETATCDELKAGYKFYAGYIAESIKSQYVFSCVADKEDMEMLR
jgi:prolipoprotein diacylglyceryltransferase